MSNRAVVSLLVAVAVFWSGAVVPTEALESQAFAQEADEEAEEATTDEAPPAPELTEAEKEAAKKAEEAKKKAEEAAEKAEAEKDETEKLTKEQIRSESLDEGPVRNEREAAADTNKDGKVSGAERETEQLEEENTAAALGAANPVVASNTGKPWQLMANLGLSVGSGTFVQNAESQIGYNVSLTGLYRLAPLLDGRLDALVRVAFDQVLDEGFGGGSGGRPNYFFFRDTRVGLLGRGLFKWDLIGMTFGVNTSVDLPTSEQAQNWGRWFRWNVGFNMANMVQDVGPGSLLINAGFTFRKDVGEVNPTIDGTTDDGSQILACRTTNQSDTGACFTDVAPLNFAFIYGLSLRYFLGDVSLGLGATFVDNFNHSLNDSDTSGVPYEVTESIYANDAPDHTFLMSLGADLTYVFSSNFNLSAGISSFQVPFRYQGDNPRAAVVPFFDSPEYNSTSVYLNATVMY